MRWLFWLLAIIAFAAGAALLTTVNQGYVLIVRPPYRLEISLNFLIVLIVLTFILLHLILSFIHYIQQLPASVRGHRETKQLKASHDALLKKLSSNDSKTGAAPDN